MSGGNSGSPPSRRTMRIGTINISLVDEPVGPELTLDARLAHQFVYFKDQFLEAASSLGIAVPLDIVEDKSGHIYPFLQASGPKYIFQIMQGNMHNVHLLRCALSVLIITTTLLRKRIQDMEASDARNHVHKPNLEKEWAKQALNKFSDSVTMGSCITILINTYNPVVQELTLNLMATLIAVSEEAIRQMLLAPNSRLSWSGHENQKALSMHLKRLNSRLNTADSAPVESRRQSVVAGSMVLPTSVMTGANAEMRKSIFQKDRAATMRQSRLLDAMDEPPAGISEEHNSCLAHILSVVLMQKNRQLLLGACADVIVAMAQNASSELCEIIARTPTCALPLVELDRHLSTKKKQQKTAPVNPLGSKIIEWAGLKIPLKFLQKYHSLYSVRPAADEDGSVSLRASTSQTKEEYGYAHDSALRAISQLIANSKEVVAEVLRLPGALDLLQLSVGVYASNHGDMVDAAILNAVNTLQMEKQHRERAEADERQPTPPLERPGGVGVRSPTTAKSPVLPAMRGAASQRQGPGGSKRNAKANHSADDFDWATASITAAPARLTDNTQPVTLTDNHQVTFGAPYTEETEKARLYLLRQADKVTRDRGEASDFTKAAADELRGTVQAPIHQAPSVDTLLEHSLQAIDVNTAESILQPRGETRDRDPAYAQRLGLSRSAQEPLADLSFSSYYKDSSSLSNAARPTLTTPNGRPGTGEKKKGGTPAGHGMSASRDFFGKMPSKPFVPKRIEPKDCIHPAEDLDKIRQKFQLIAENAVMKIKHDGVVRNGRNTASIEERARRVYSPKRLPALGRSKSSAAALGAGTATDSGAQGGEGLMLLSLDGPDMPQPAMQATRGDSEHFQLLTEEDERTPAWNSISSAEAGYFGFKLDNAELEEPGLFDNFKPIFDYAARPEPAGGKPTTAASASRPNTMSGKVFESSVLAPPRPFMEAAEDPLLN